MTIEFLGPLALAVIAIRRPSHVAAALLALVGVVLVTGATPSGDLAGFLLAFASAACWASYILATRRAGRWEGTGDSLAVAVAVAAIASAPLWIGAAPHFAGADGAALVLVAVALLGKVLPYRLELDALGQLSPGTAGIIFSVEPAIAVLVGVVALGERLTVEGGLGVAAVVLAGFLALRDSAEAPTNP